MLLKGIVTSLLLILSIMVIVLPCISAVLGVKAGVKRALYEEALREEVKKALNKEVDELIDDANQEVGNYGVAVYKDARAFKNKMDREVNKFSKELLNKDEDG